MTAAQQPKPETAIASVGPRARIGLERFSVAQFLIALVVLFMTLPFLDAIPDGEIIEGILMTLVMVSGVMAVGRRRGVLLMAVILVLPALAGKWLSHYRKDLLPPQVFPAAGLVFVAFVVWQLLRFVLRAPRVNSEVLCAGISTYLLLGLLWMFAYLLVAQWDPHAFAFDTGPAASHLMNRFNAYYFSFVTLATVGYGDVTPVSNVTRALAVLEGMTGTLYVAVLIARLVALYSSETIEKGELQSGPPKP